MHFFIEHTQLTNQNNGGVPYGPVVGDLTNKFNVTSQFQLSLLFTNTAKAFACELGSMIVQQSTVDASLVNIILKPIPNNSKKISAQEVKYYIYRGILKSSLIIESNGIYQIQPKATSSNNIINNELIKRIYEKPELDLSAGTLGYDTKIVLGSDVNTLPDTTDVEIVFGYSKKPEGIQPIWVLEGEWIGDFTKESNHKIGFEVILKDDLLSKIDLGYVRKEKHQIDVTGLPDDLTLKATREKILPYIDPAAFFGQYYDIGIDTKTYLGTTPTKIKKIKEGIYNTLLTDKFSTSNKVYLDIRSEKGYSYNFYNNYWKDSSSLIDFKFGEGINLATTPPDKIYNTSSWPIIILDTPQSPNPFTSPKNNVQIMLRINDNISPIVLVENKAFLDKKKRVNYINGNVELATQGTYDWTKKITLSFPNTIHPTDATKKNNIASYIKIYYFRRKDNPSPPTIVPPPPPSPVTVLKNVKYYDSAFCSIDLPRLGLPSIGGHLKSGMPNYIREPLQTNGTGNFEYFSNNGAYWDAHRILFYTKISDFTKEGSEDKINLSINSSEKKFINTFPKKLNNINTLEYTRTGLGQDFDIICRKYYTPEGEIKIIGINSYKKSGVLQDKENLILLGLTIAEVNAIKSNSELSDKHLRYIFLEHVNANDNYKPLTDNTLISEIIDGETVDIPQHYRYHKYTVKLQGLVAINGHSDIKTPQLDGIPIYVYSRDNTFFSSKEFSKNEQLSSGLNQIEFHIYNNGTININDNIDLSMVRKKKINIDNNYYELENEGETTDLSKAQQISYWFHDNSFFDSNQFAPRKICNLNILQANKMKKKQTFSNNILPTGFDTLTIDYSIFQGNSGVNAKESYNNEDGDIFTTNNTDVPKDFAGQARRYNNQKKIVHMVYFLPMVVNSSQLINNRFIYEKTLRHFANPLLAASFIGALIEIEHSIICQGFAYSDGTCFPSSGHVNGEALDTNYNNLLAKEMAFIVALNKFGFRLHYIGSILKKVAYNGSDLDDLPYTTKDYTGLHDTHLHSQVTEKIII